MTSTYNPTTPSYAFQLGGAHADLSDWNKRRCTLGLGPITVDTTEEDQLLATPRPEAYMKQALADGVPMDELKITVSFCQAMTNANLRKTIDQSRAIKIHRALTADIPTTLAGLSAKADDALDTVVAVSTVLTTDDPTLAETQIATDTVSEVREYLSALSTLSAIASCFDLSRHDRAGALAQYLPFVDLVEGLDMAEQQEALLAVDRALSSTMVTHPDRIRGEGLLVWLAKHPSFRLDYAGTQKEVTRRGDQFARALAWVDVKDPGSHRPSTRVSGNAIPLSRRGGFAGVVTNNHQEA